MNKERAMRAMSAKVQKEARKVKASGWSLADQLRVAATEAKALSLIEQAIKEGADLSARGTSQGLKKSGALSSEAPLSKCLREGWEKASLRLIEAGAQARSKEEEISKLGQAIRWGSDRVVEALLKAGASPKEESSEGSMLRMALKRGRSETVRALLAAGASAKEKDAEGVLALGRLMLDAMWGDEDKLRVRGARCADWVGCAKALLDAGADPSRSGSGHEAPLIWAAQVEGSAGEPLVRLLLEEGANPAAKADRSALEEALMVDQIGSAQAIWEALKTKPGPKELGELMEKNLEAGSPAKTILWIASKGCPAIVGDRDDPIDWMVEALCEIQMSPAEQAELMSARGGVEAEQAMETGRRVGALLGRKNGGQGFEKAVEWMRMACEDEVALMLARSACVNFIRGAQGKVEKQDHPQLGARSERALASLEADIQRALEVRELEKESRRARVQKDSKAEASRSARARL